MQIYSTYDVQKHHARFLANRRMDYPQVSPKLKLITSVLARELTNPQFQGVGTPNMYTMYADIETSVTQQAKWEMIDKDIKATADGHVEVTVGVSPQLR